MNAESHVIIDEIVLNLLRRKERVNKTTLEILDKSMLLGTVIVRSQAMKAQVRVTKRQTIVSWQIIVKARNMRRG